MLSNSIRFRGVNRKTIATTDGQSHPKVTGGQVRDLAVDVNAKKVEGLYKAHKKGLCNWIQRRYKKDASYAEEVAQKAFTKILEIDTIADIVNPKAFIYKVAVNYILMDVRKNETIQNFIDKELSDFSRELEEMTPERIYMSEKRCDQFIRGTEALTSKQKKILYLSRVEAKSYEQIRQETGWSISDISRQIKKAMSIIRAEMAE